MCARRMAGSSLRCLSISSSIQYPTYEILNNNMSYIANHYQRTSNVYKSQQQHIMSFSTRTRRRRRGGGAVLETFQPISPEEDDNNYNTSSTTTTAKSLSEEQFVVVANSLLDKVESAMIKLVDCNDGLEITRYPLSSSEESSTDLLNGDEEDVDSEKHAGKLSIQIESSGDMFWGGGTYWLTILPESSGLVKLQSPLSGSFSYVFLDGEWVNSEDGHSLLGMFTRDWIRQAKGVPEF